MTTREKAQKPESEIVQALSAQLGKAPVNYALLLDELKGKIRSARIRAGLAANREMVLLYWEIGRRILDSQRQEVGEQRLWIG